MRGGGAVGAGGERRAALSHPKAHRRVVSTFMYKQRFRFGFGFGIDFGLVWSWFSVVLFLGLTLVWFGSMWFSFGLCKFCL